MKLLTEFISHGCRTEISNCLLLAGALYSLRLPAFLPCALLYLQSQQWKISHGSTPTPGSNGSYFLFSQLLNPDLINSCNHIRLTPIWFLFWSADLESYLHLQNLCTTVPKSVWWWILCVHLIKLWCPASSNISLYVSVKVFFRCD